MQKSSNNSFDNDINKSKLYLREKQRQSKLKYLLLPLSSAHLIVSPPA
jgi:hypothetical protein